MLMDTGGQVSVLPLSVCQKLKPPVNLPVPTREVATYGNNTVKFHGPVPLHVQLCGLTILHPYYIVDDSKAGLAPVIGSCDLMKSGRMVLDIDNQLLWSRLTHSLTDHPSPNPMTSIPNTKVRSVVCFAELPSRDVEPPAVPSEHDAVDPDPASVAPQRSNVLSRQVKTVLPPVGLRVPVFRPVLSPSAPVFCPRADRLPPTSNISKQPTAFRVSVVECDDTLLKTHVGPSRMLSLESTDLTVPSHLQDLFDKSVTQDDLAPSHQCSLAALLRRHSDAFATGPMDLGYCSVLEHDIDTGDVEPIRQPPRRPPLSARQAEEDILNEMLQTGVIEPSNSPWSSPVCMVRKKDGSNRYCVDYRRLNSVTIKDAFPVPNVKDALDSLRGAKYFATIDLLSGYWQLRMTQRARERSAFCTRRGLYQFIRMPFGLSNAPASFCRRMQIILHDLLYVCCICYLDDIIVFGETPEQLMENLDIVFTRLKEKGLKAKPSKCVLFRSPIYFLGHMVSADGIQPQPDKLAAIRDRPTPHCLRDVRAFYCLASYYRKFVKDFAKIAEPLSRMTKKNTPFTWTDETQQSFDDLKTALLHVDTLAYPTPGDPMHSGH